ncbi:MAG TPA: hypothetical protein VG327_05405 [Mycobacterium sp.]|nr:hypothetical protein [Mycobacterium sp.]
MSVQDDKGADQANGQQLTEKPEPDEDDKKKAAEMMTAYEDRPTLVLPGTSGMVSGTAVNDWLDEEGNPRINEEAGDDQGEDEDADAKKEQIEKDKAWNEELRDAAKQENKGEKG